MKIPISILFMILAIVPTMPSFLFAGGACSGGVTIVEQITPTKQPENMANKEAEKKSAVENQENDHPIVTKLKIKELLSEILSAEVINIVASYNGEPMHFNDICSQFKRDKQMQKAELGHLMRYYNFGQLEKSDYLRDVAHICAQADNVLKKPCKNALVVFDIDDSLLTRYYDYYFRYVKSHYAHITKRHTAARHHRSNEAIALMPVKQLWDTVIARGFKVAIISCAPTSLLKERIAELTQAGYTFPPDVQILFFEEKLYNTLANNPQCSELVSKRKLDFRKQLAQSHTIAANVGDFDTDFYGDETGNYSGHEVRLPNFILRG